MGEQPSTCIRLLGGKPQILQGASPDRLEEATPAGTKLSVVKPGTVPSCPNTHGEAANRITDRSIEAKSEQLLQERERARASACVQLSAADAELVSSFVRETDRKDRILRDWLLTVDKERCLVPMNAAPVNKKPAVAPLFFFKKKNPFKC